MRRKPEVPEEEVPVGENFDCPARITSKETCTSSYCEKWHPPECMFYKSKSGCRMLKKHEPYDRTVRPVVCNSSNTRQLGCVFQDMEPPKSSSILRKSSDIRKPIRREKFTKAVARHADIRDQNPSLGLICPGEPHQRSPNAPKFEDRSQEETEWHREAAWKLAKSVFRIKGEKHSNILLTFGK